MRRLLWFLVPLGVLSAQVSSVQMLRSAERRGDLETVGNLLAAGISANDRSTPLKETALSLAMVSGYPRVVDLLLAYHADPNAPMTGANPGSETPLQYAAERGDVSIARSLIAAGARVNDAGGFGRTPLHLALPNHLEMIRLLIEKGADVNQRDAEGASPLDDAVWTGNLDAAAIFIAHGARLNEPDIETGATPVNEAAFRGHTEIIRYLLQFRPDVTVADKRGFTPLQNAIRNGREDAALLLLDAEPAARRTPQFLGSTTDAALAKDQSLVVETLLRQGMNINEALPSGYTPLDAAAFSGASKTERTLLDRGADPNTPGKDGTTPLDDAAAKGFDAIAAMLLDAGARSSVTALHSAAAAGHLSTVKLLLDRGANPSGCSADRRTPYQIAIANDHRDVAAEIKSRGGAEGCH